MNEDVAKGRLTYSNLLADSGGRELHAAAKRSEGLSVALYSSPPYAMSLPPLGVSRLSINLSPSRVAGGLIGDRPRAFMARRHSLFLTPAGAGASWNKISSSRHINIYFDPVAFDFGEDAAGSPWLRSAVPLLNVGLEGAGAMFDMLASELGEPQPLGAEAVDSLARLILVRMSRRHAGATASANPLTPALRRRLNEYLDSRLDQRVLVADMAAVTGLAPNRFAQSFASATGESPHQFVMALRLARAVGLLKRSTATLADIAAACGFASQQHMTRVMRRRLGITPARQRAISPPHLQPAHSAAVAGSASTDG